MELGGVYKLYHLFLSLNKCSVAKEKLTDGFVCGRHLVAGSFGPQATCRSIYLNYWPCLFSEDTFQTV